MTSVRRFLLPGCGLVLALAWLVYSYGFVDFNLTLASHPLVNGFISWSQQLAMFDRPMSLSVYLFLVIASFFCYWLALRLAARRNHQFPWKIVLTIALVFVFAFPLLSSDVFKYLFVAKEVLVYHANPYLVTPQEFPADTWLRFMRWIHTPSPYGPVFTGYTLPFYLATLGKFTPMLYLYKLAQLGWYALTIWSLGRLGASVKARLFFALNPLVLVEWLSSAHNDAIMISLFLLAFSLAVRRRYLWSLGSLLLSLGVKYVTGFFLPLIFLVKPRSRVVVTYLSLLALALAPLVYHYSYQYQPWYVTWLVPIAAMLGNPIVMWMIGAYTFGAFLRYIPFISLGLWEGSPAYFAWLTFGPVLVSIIIFLPQILSRVRKTQNQL